ncbi:hypothetical protein AVEN_28586-1 [Araneus ventricosus]|uniref:Uncharacterized protein n=1 Tax=Araneus ventricosus TaxID=182803 RepID=A0A4Y2DFQ0_ARAVE|nr:hypothetical protein AVEN_28586-1 [Araneus ventricosus]
MTALLWDAPNQRLKTATALHHLEPATMRLTLKRPVIHPGDVTSGQHRDWLVSLCSCFTLRSRPRQRSQGCQIDRQIVAKHTRVIVEKLHVLTNSDSLVNNWVRDFEYEYRLKYSEKVRKSIKSVYGTDFSAMLSLNFLK